MDKVYDHKSVEEKLYRFWEESGFFKPEINPQGEPYTIILPPPNANGDLHFGHAMFVIEDVLIRYHRMKGFRALWLPGSDHAGTETQFVFEKKLQSEDKSRFDFSRQDLYQKIWDYVAENRGGIFSQLRRLGFSLDWSRERFTLDKDVVELVNSTFQKMYNDKLVYRDYRLVNYCTRDGTSFSDLETVSEEVEGALYYVKYPLKEGSSITVATTRPETMFGDVAVMVNPEDKRYHDLIGQTVILPLTNREIPVIADSYVDREFGTGAVKVTPSHDFNDFEVGRKHNLTFPPVIGWSGKFERTGIVDGLYVKQAREKTIELLKEGGFLEKEEKHKMVIKKCYKCKTVLEPLPLEQWYVKVAPLAGKALEVVEKEEVKIYPANFVTILKSWYKNLKDWNISRQNVWGIRIPVWYEIEDESWFAVSFLNKNNELKQGILSELLQEYGLEEIESGLQRVIARMEAKVVFAEQKEAGKRYLPETDTFDTWFSSGQWPYVTLKTTNPSDFETFYPTSVMETGRDILYFWVSRMIMLGIYLTDGRIPFKNVVLHGLVNDPYGKKMSKSKGNVVNPLQVADEYGADAVRMALLYGTALGNDQAMSYAKLQAMRNFSNKLWNMGRFIMEFKPDDSAKEISAHPDDKEMLEKLKGAVAKVTTSLDQYRFNDATEFLYDFVWHEFADKYIEKTKERRAQAQPCLEHVFMECLKLLHPFMPFITEEIYQKMPHQGKSLMIENWPRKQ